MTRSDFESLPSRKQRIYAERQYAIVSAMIFTECRENGIFSDDFGQLSEIHHAWHRSHAPLWYLFQKENMFPISHDFHIGVIHGKAPSDMTPKEREYYDHFQDVKEKLKQENKDYENH